VHLVGCVIRITIASFSLVGQFNEVTVTHITGAFVMYESYNMVLMVCRICSWLDYTCTRFLCGTNVLFWCVLWGASWWARRVCLSFNMCRWRPQQLACCLRQWRTDIWLRVSTQTLCLSLPEGHSGSSTWTL